MDVSVNTNAVLSEGFLAEYRKVTASCGNANLRFLWHGCGPGVLPTLLQSGMTQPASSPVYACLAKLR